MESNAGIPGMLGDVCGDLGCNLVHLSTPGVTGLGANVSEDTEYSPWGDYESSKVQGEKNLLDNPRLHSHLLTILRPDFVYGPGDMHKFPLFRQVARGWIPLVGFSGARLRPTYCMDVCRAVESSMPGGLLNGGLYNIAGPEVLSMRELTAAIAGSLGSGLLRIPVPRWIFKASLLLGPLCPRVLSESRLKLFGKDHFVSITKAEEAGFRPSFHLSQGLSETVAWYRDRGLLN
jgi:nucleoside-diphosphate-sugar epimerase